MSAGQRATPDAPRIRSFLAADLEPALLESLSALQGELAACKADVRWVRPEGMHVTLKFLGAVPVDLLGRIRAVVSSGICGVAPIVLRAHGIGAFPSWRRPRVVWVGLDDGGRLAGLAQRIDELIEPLGFAREKRRFTPHVTLGRVNSMRRWAALEEHLKAHIDAGFGACTVQDVVLYRSTLQRSGAVYTQLWTIPLTENRGTA
jgi:2'-5' RNA ligase